MAHTFTNLLVHLVFSTKDRRPSIDAQLKPTLFPYMGGIVREMKGKALAVNGTENHVHILAKLPSTLSIAEVVRVLKTNSSRWVHEKGYAGHGFAWQVGYGAFSVSQSNVESVIRYIATQEEHHRNVSFQDEYLSFLRKHEIEFDERYIWG